MDKGGATASHHTRGAAAIGDKGQAADTPVAVVKEQRNKVHRRRSSLLIQMAQLAAQSRMIVAASFGGRVFVRSLDLSRS